MADPFQAFADGVMSGVAGLAKDTLGGLTVQATSDAKGFLAYSETNLRAWTMALAHGEMTRDEFADLADDLLDLGKLVALSDLGIAKAALQRFRDGLISLLVDTAFKTFLPGG